MQLKPDELPDMVEGEIRMVTLILSGAVGTNEIEDCAVTSDGLTIGTPSISGTSLSFLVTAGSAGDYYILASADLSSAETVKGYIRAKVNGQPCESSGSTRYDDD